MNQPVKHCYEFGHFRLDAIQRLLLRNGEIVPLTPKAFEILLFLVQHYGRVLSKDELMKAVWPDCFVEEANLARQISVLRKVLGESNGEHRYIETLPRRGYRFFTSVVERCNGHDEPTTLQQARSFAIGPAAVRSVAVLPFQSLSADESDAALGLGMADAVITKLGNLRQVLVRPTSVMRKYTNSHPDTAVVGGELCVEYVLEGSIQRSGVRIRVTAQLVSVLNGAPLWCAQFDEQFTDLFTVEDSISGQLSRALSWWLSGVEQPFPEVLSG
ncbi:MAG: winged helix-turn-helix domain-containing protein [Acidobacteria bacterium]|nr:winged helix-turn-helix domain-containing protein [Acidobacteriota bacterium]